MEQKTMSSMSLSHAIRLGATMKPQGFDWFINDGRTCALGAAMDAFGRLFNRQLPPWPKEILETFSRIDGEKCPACHSRLPFLTGMIPHLNDDHRWTREQIADFVELHEPLPIADVPVEESAVAQ